MGTRHARCKQITKQLSDKLQASLQRSGNPKKDSSYKDRQIRAKDNQLEKMQKLLDQSQQLQLMAENKFKAGSSHNEPEQF